MGYLQHFQCRGYRLAAVVWTVFTRSFYFSCSKQWSVVSDVLCCFNVRYCLQQFACLLMFVVFMIFMLQFSSFLNLLFHLGSGRSSQIPALCHAPPAPPQRAQRGAKNEDVTMKNKEIQRKNKIWKKEKIRLQLNIQLNTVIKEIEHDRTDKNSIWAQVTASDKSAFKVVTHT